VKSGYSNSPYDRASFQGSSFATGVEIQEKRKRVNIISTGSKNVDGILGGMQLDTTETIDLTCQGGLMSQSISEGNRSPQCGSPR